jgi:hypothetical protein
MGKAGDIQEKSWTFMKGVAALTEGLGCPPPECGVLDQPAESQKV